MRFIRVKNPLFSAQFRITAVSDTITAKNQKLNYFTIDYQPLTSLIWSSDFHHLSCTGTDSVLEKADVNSDYVLLQTYFDDHQEQRRPGTQISVVSTFSSIKIRITF